MTTYAYICFGLVALVILVTVLWRIASRRHSLPCPVWLSWLVELDNPFAKVHRSDVIIEHLDLQPGMTVLDIGCGPGRLTIPVAKQVGQQGQVVAIDIQPGMLRRAQDKAKAANLTNIRFQEAAVGEGKLEHNQSDRALLVTVLGEIPDRPAALKRNFRRPKARRHTIRDRNHFRSSLSEPCQNSTPRRRRLDFGRKRSSAIGLRLH